MGPQICFPTAFGKPSIDTAIGTRTSVHLHIENAVALVEDLGNTVWHDKTVVIKVKMG